MAIKYWVAGCTNEPANADKEMSDIKTWDNMVWHAYHNAHVRYCHWKEGHFKSGAMQQIYLAEVEVDIFDPVNSKITLLYHDFHPYQKTVVYNKNAELDSLKKAAPTSIVAKNVGKAFNFNTGQLVNNYLVQGAQEAWPSPIQNPYGQASAPNWDDLYNELHTNSDN